MLPKMIEGATAIVGESQVEFEGLPIRRTLLEWQDERGNSHVNTAMISEWYPTVEELASLNAGGSVFLTILNLPMHPPVMLTVGPPPKEDDTGGEGGEWACQGGTRMHCHVFCTCDGSKAEEIDPRL